MMITQYKEDSTGKAPEEIDVLAISKGDELRIILQNGRVFEFDDDETNRLRDFLNGVKRTSSWANRPITNLCGQQ